MDYQSFADTCNMSCAVLSVEKVGENSYGDIRIICANEQYKQTMGPGYYDNMPYQELVPKDLKFEDFCYRAAVQGECMHAYVETKALNCWTDQKMIPLKSDRDDVGYCQFLFEFTQNADPSRMATVSMETAEAVIKASISLLDATDFIEGVKEVQRDILRISEGFACRIMLIDHRLQTATTFCEQFPENMNIPSSDDLPDLDYELVNSWEKMLGYSNCVIMKNEHDMADLERRNPAWVQSLRAYGVTTMVLIPLRRQGKVYGWLYVVNFNADKTVLVKELLELMAFILGSEISNYLLLDQLEVMSKVDALTGIMNRNAMNARMSLISEADCPMPYGIINLDLNGLKTVNDNEGHDAGDRLLVEAAEVLRKVFHYEDLFRTGGDEFIVISTGITRDAFDRKVKRLESDMEKNARVQFAVGPFWSDGSDTLREAFQQADARMYENKRAYYEAHPDKRRR